MAKKLTIEVDADTTKAKQKVQALSATGGSSALGGGSVSPSADKAARSLERAAQGADRLNKSAQAGSANISQMSKVFGGLAVRMAAGYASSHMEKGSTSQVVTKGAGDVIGGAISGSAFGPIGALAGGIMGLTSAIMEAKAAEEERAKALRDTAVANREQLDIMLASEKRTDEFKEKMASMTDTTRSAAERQKELQAELERLQERDKLNVSGMVNGSRAEQADENSDKDFKRNSREHSANRGEIEAIKSALKSLASENKKNGGSAFRESMTATDALSRIGGGSFGGDFAKQQLEAQKETVTVLKSIDQKTRNGGAAWQ